MKMKMIVLAMLLVSGVAQAQNRIEDLRKLADGSVKQGQEGSDSGVCFAKLEADRTGSVIGLLRLEIQFSNVNLLYFEIPVDAKLESVGTTVDYQYAHGDRTRLSFDIAEDSLKSITVKSKTTTLTCTELKPLQ